MHSEQIGRPHSGARRRRSPGPGGGSRSERRALAVSVVASCAVTSLSHPPRRRPRHWGSWSTSCGRPRRSPRRSRPGTSGCSAAPKSRTRWRSRPSSAMPRSPQASATRSGSRRSTRAPRRGVPRAARGDARSLDDERHALDRGRGRLVRRGRAQGAPEPRRGRRRPRARGSDTIVLCAGYKGVFAIDDAYCAGRIVRLLEAERTDSAVASAGGGRALPERDRRHQRADVRATRASRRTSPGAPR